MSRRWRRIAGLVVGGLVAAAVAQELAKPPQERTWRGRVLGLVPYNFNWPTWEQVREAYWNPNDSRLFTECVLGVGWAVNLHRAGELLSGLFSRLAAMTDQPISLAGPDRE